MMRKALEEFWSLSNDDLTPEDRLMFKNELIYFRIETNIHNDQVKSSVAQIYINYPWRKDIDTYGDRIDDLRRINDLRFGLYSVACNFYLCVDSLVHSGIFYKKVEKIDKNKINKEELIKHLIKECLI